MFLLVPAHPGCPGQIPQSRKTVVYVCVCVLRKQQKTLGGYFILPHPVETISSACDILNTLTKVTEQHRMSSRGLLQCLHLTRIMYQHHIQMDFHRVLSVSRLICGPPTHNRFTALLDFVWDYLGEPAPER